MEELCSRLKDLQSEQGECSAVEGRSRMAVVTSAGLGGTQPTRAREATRVKFVLSVCHQASVMPCPRLSLLGQLSAVTCCQRTGFIHRCPGREESFHLCVFKSKLRGREQCFLSQPCAPVNVCLLTARPPKVPTLVIAGLEGTSSWTLRLFGRAGLTGS